MMPLLRRGATIHPDGILAEAAKDTIPSWCEVYDPAWAYTRYGDGEEEYYDLAKDPFEFDNVVSNAHYAEQVKRARHTLDTLCRPRPPGWHESP